MASPLNIFIIYSAKDNESRNELLKRLKLLVKEKILYVWTDQEIPPGTPWNEDIQRNLKKTDIFIALVSADFYDSDYIQNIEMPFVEISMQSGKSILIPIILRPCPWKHDSIISSLQILPPNRIPISDTHWKSNDEAWDSVIDKIAIYAKELLKDLKFQSTRSEYIDAQIAEENQLIAMKLKMAADEYDNENYEKAYQIFEKYKKSPLFIAEYQRRLGKMYHSGQGAKVDFYKAKELYEKAAELDDGWAMNNIGLLFYNGQGVIQDFQKAREWFLKAYAKKDDVRAMYNLGLLFLNGQGVTQDYQKAKEWYEKAAKSGYTSAMCSIGFLYKNGYGVDQNYQKAKEWYEKAAELGDAQAMNNIGNIFYNGQGVAQDINQAKKWYEKAAKLGDGWAMYSIGYIYMYGIGNHEQSYQKAIKWFENAATKGNDAAMTMLGIINHYGKGVIIDLEKAKVWYEKASEKGDSIAMSNLGEIFRDGGEGVPKNTQKAIEWFEKAIKHGNEETKEKLLNLKLV